MLYICGMNELKFLPLFKVQPGECRIKLPEKQVNCTDLEKSILFFDPYNLYKDIEKYINPLSRFNNIPFSIIEKHIPKSIINPLEQIKWVKSVKKIIDGDIPTIKHYIGLYYEKRCNKCGSFKVEIDHIYRVCIGGGSAWLSNYQYLCRECNNHKPKNNDFVLLNYIKKYPISLYSYPVYIPMKLRLLV